MEYLTSVRLYKVNILLQIPILRNDAGGLDAGDAGAGPAQPPDGAQLGVEDAEAGGGDDAGQGGR